MAGTFGTLGTFGDIGDIRGHWGHNMRLPFFDVSDSVFCALSNEHAYNPVALMARKINFLTTLGYLKSTKFEIFENFFC